MPAAPTAKPFPWLSIGELARRSGVAASALRYYESQGLLHSARSAGGQRRYPRDALRRVAFIRAAQIVGIRLDDIRGSLAALPSQRTPTPRDWEALSADWLPRLQQRIDELTRLRDRLGNCIGCGCLSLSQCALYNPGDRAASLGEGPRYLIGEPPTEAADQDDG